MSPLSARRDSLAARERINQRAAFCLEKHLIFNLAKKYLALGCGWMRASRCQRTIGTAARREKWTMRARKHAYSQISPLIEIFAPRETSFWLAAPPFQSIFREVLFLAQTKRCSFHPIYVISYAIFNTFCSNK